jgi:hypothetical protein
MAQQGVYGVTRVACCRADAIQCRHSGERVGGFTRHDA